MKRREFINAAVTSTLMNVLFGGCSYRNKLPNSRHLVDIPEKRAEYLDRMLKALCTDLGPHPVGSLEYNKAALIIKGEMEKALPVVEFDTFTFNRWRILSEPEFYVGDTRLETFPSHGAGDTPEKGITGILHKSDINRVPYVVVDRSSGETIARVTISESWATGLAVSRPYYYYDDEPGGLPTFNVGRQEITLLDAAVSEKTQVRMNVQTDFVPNTSTSNIVGTFPGESTDEIILFAHLDTVYNSPGANDNTASLIMILMIAHAVSGVRPKKTLTFIATTGEEYRYLGTVHYAKRRKREGTLKNIKLLMNFDSITWGPNMEIGTQSKELMELISEIDSDLNIDGTPEWLESDGLGREATPFKDEGVEALGMVMGANGYKVNHVWHRPDDIAENVPGDCAEIAFLLFNEFIKRVQDM